MTTNHVDAELAFLEIADIAREALAIARELATKPSTQDEYETQLAAKDTEIAYWRKKYDEAATLVGAKDRQIAVLASELMQSSPLPPESVLYNDNGLDVVTEQPPAPISNAEVHDHAHGDDRDHPLDTF